MSRPKGSMVWVVDDGDYSDYHVEGVFSTRAQAEAAIASGAVKGDIDSWELDTHVTTKDYIEAGWRIWEVDFAPNGDIRKYTYRSGTIERGVNDSFHSDLKRGEWNGGYYGPQHHNKPDRGKCSVELWAKDRAGAIKVAAEKRRELIIQADLEQQLDFFHLRRDGGEEEWK